MASPQLERLADSALLKLTSSAFALILCPALLWNGARLVDRLDRVESLLAEAKADKATTELRLKALESTEQEHGADLKRLGDKVLVHDFQLNDLQRGGKR